MPDGEENSNKESKATQKSGEALRVVGIGASAGGLSACTELLEHLRADTGMAFVVILHMDPSRKSHLGDLLSRSTEMPVSTITSKTKLEPNHVYVIAPGTVLDIENDTVTPRARDEVAATRKPINTLFEGIAKSKREYAIGVVLSGTGNDGTDGLGEIKRAGGICLVQSPESAEFNGMPSAAIEAGVADQILRPVDMGEYLLKRVGVSREAVGEASDSDSDASNIPAEDLKPESQAFRDILKLLAEHHGLDFEDYRLGTLTRRISRRISIHNLPDLDAYLVFLRKNAAELHTLYQDLLIDVTQFFRDPDVWAYLEEDVIPKIIAENDDAHTLRFWVSACSTGEEAYSLAILVQEALEAAGKARKVRIFATDVNARALEIARRGLYPASIAEDLSDARLERHFERHGDHLQVKRGMREVVTFAVHNVLTNPPFSRMNIVTCRNLLIYLKPEAQQRALEMLEYALQPCAYLVLGTSESISGSGLSLDTISKKLRIFQSPSDAEHSTRPQPARRPIPERLQTGSIAPLKQGKRDDSRRKERFFERYILGHYAPAAVVVTKTLEIKHFFGPTDDYLQPPTGATDLDLLAWLRPGLYAGLQAALKESIEGAKRVETEMMRVERADTTYGVNCRVEPLASTPGGSGLYLVVFRSPSEDAGVAQIASDEGALVKKLETQLRDARRENSQLLESLNATNEDYQAHHEELLSLNEELQSSNEELESSKEELQSLNEELLTVNQQFEVKNDELAQVNADLNNLFLSTQIPTIFLDKEFKIRRFTPASTQVMHLAPSDVGRSIEDVKERFDKQDLLGLSKEVLKTGEPSEREIHTEDDLYYHQRILPYRTEEGDIKGVSITFIEITKERQEMMRAERNREYSDAVIRTVRTALLVLDEDLCVTRANRFFKQHFMEDATPVVGVRVFDVGEGRWDIPRLRELLIEVLPEKQEVIDYELEHDFGGLLGERVLRINAHTMVRPHDKQQILMSIEDISEQRHNEAMLESRRREMKAEQVRKNEFLAMLGHELRNPLAALGYGLDFLSVVEEPEKIKKTQQMMGRQLLRMTSMLDQLLEMSRVAEGKIVLHRERLDLSEVARNAIDVVIPHIEQRKQHLGISLPAQGELMLEGDANRLAQVIENLLINAVKYTDVGGQIEVKLKQRHDNAVFSVCDTGVGIDAELMPSIFELFVQAGRSLERSEGGFGLGLPLAKELIELHGGELTAFSDGLGEGSTFTFSIPINAGPAALELEHPSETDAADDDSEPDEEGTSEHDKEGESEALRILVIDDEEELAELFVRLLQRRGYRTEMAPDGLSGIERVRTFRPRVILLDLGLPGIDGYEVARRLREEFSDRKLFIVAVSGYERNPPKLNAAGFDRHLLKPPDMDRLQRWIEALD